MCISGASHAAKARRFRLGARTARTEKVSFPILPLISSHALLWKARSGAKRNPSCGSQTGSSKLGAQELHLGKQRKMA